jgi:hypothetical protein
MLKDTTTWSQQYFWDMDCVARLMRLVLRRFGVCVEWLVLCTK